MNWTHIMYHCADTPPTFDVKREHIEKWHIKERGWRRVGYSILYERSGISDILIPFDRDDVIESWEISNGARGWNGRTKHLCYAGGRAEGGGVEDNRSQGQRIAMANDAKLLVMLYPDIKIIGHNQVSIKYCPSYDVPEWAESIGISPANIDYKNYQ
jgi:N-acetylmuramoyl-L-alanine amidase